MLSKEKCEKAIDNVARYCSDYKLCMIPPRFELTNELEVLMDLIKEHFELVEKMGWLKNAVSDEAFELIFRNEKEVKDWIDRGQWHVQKVKDLKDELFNIQNPQPYKFEDFRIGLWVYDSQPECEEFTFFKITKILLESDCDYLYHDKNKKVFIDNMTGHAREFEEDRFFPVTKALRYCPLKEAKEDGKNVFQ